MHDEIKHIVVLQKELYILMVIKLSDDNEMCMINWKIEFFVLHGYEYFVLTFRKPMYGFWLQFLKSTILPV